MAKQSAEKVEVSYRTIVFTVCFLLGLWFVYEIRQLIMLAFVALVMMTAINPMVDSLQRKRVPRVMGILLVYLIILVVLAGAVIGIVPLVVAQTEAFARRVPDILRLFEDIGVGRAAIGNQLGQLWSVPLDILGVVVDIFSNLLNILVVAVVTFYLLIERGKLDKYLGVLFGREGSEEARIVADKLERRLGNWVRGEVILMLSVGLFSYLGFKILGIDVALPLGILAGILEIIPNVGPVVAGVMAVVSGLSVGPAVGIGALAWAFIVQQVEANFLVPKVMQSSTGVHPVISIFSLLIGLKLAGTTGAIFAIPVVIVIGVVVESFLARNGLGERRGV